MNKLLIFVAFFIVSIATQAQNQWTLFRLQPTSSSLNSGDGWMKINSSTNKWNVRINGTVENVAMESYVDAAIGSSSAYWKVTGTTTLTGTSTVNGGSNDLSIGTTGSFKIGLGVAPASVHAGIQFTNTANTRQIILQEGANNNHQFYGFGTTGAGGSLDYHVSNTGGSHKFIAGTSSSTSTDLFTIVGDGRLLIGVTPTTNNSATSVLVFDTGEIKLRDVSTISGSGFWPLGSTATQTADVTIHSAGHDFRWDGAGTFITDAGNGVDLNYSSGFGLLIDIFGDINLGSPDALVFVSTGSQTLGLSAGQSTTIVSPYNATSTKPMSEPTDPFAYTFTYDDLGGTINAQLGYLNPTTSLNNVAFVDGTDAYFAIDAGGTPMKIGANVSSGVYLDAVTIGLPATVQGETSVIKSTTMNYVTRAPSGNNSVATVLTLEREPGSGTAGATGIGTAINFDFNNGSSLNKQGASLTMTTADVTNASEDSHFTIKTMFAGTLTDRLKLENDGDVIFSNSDLTWNAGLGNGGFQWSGNTIQIYDDGGDMQVTASGHMTFTASGSSKNISVSSSSGTVSIISGSDLTIQDAASGAGAKLLLDAGGATLSTNNSGDDVSISSADSYFVFTNGSERIEVEIDGAIQFNGTAGTAGQFLMTNGNSSTPTWESLPTYSASSYTPTTSSNGGVVTSSTGSECFYIRVGSIVHVEGFISVTTSGAGIASFHINLPVASDFTNQAKAPGIVTVFGGGTARGYGQVESDGTANDLLIYYTAVGATSDALKFSCTYIIQ